MKHNHFTPLIVTIKRIMKVTLFICFSFTFWSCQKDDALNPLNVIKANGSDNGTDDVYDGLTILGAQEANPYSTQHMRYAYNALVNEGHLFPGAIQLNATHLYIRTLPTNEEELNNILRCTDLDLFDYPLDYEIVAQGTYYHDPTIPDSEYTYIYTVIPMGYQFPAAYEVLDSCIIPMNPQEPNYDILSMIEDKSCELYQEDDDLEENRSGQQRRTSHSPCGTISVFNTETNSIEGIKGIKVTMRNGVKVSSKYTDNNGYYASETEFKCNKVRYTLHFQNSNGVQIYGNLATLLPAYYGKGRCSSDGLTFALYRNSVAWKWATTNNAERFYYSTICPTYNINQPASDLKIWVAPIFSNLGLANGSAPMLHKIRQQTILTDSILDFFYYFKRAAAELLPDILVIHDEQDSTHDIQSTVWHELAHASHYQKVGCVYWLHFVGGIVWNQLVNGDCYGDGTHAIDGFIGVGEMWAYFMENKTVKQFMPANSYFRNNFHFGDYWFKPEIMIDLNTNMLYVSEIFNCLTLNIHSIPALKTKLKQTYPIYYFSIEQEFNNYGF